MYSFFRDDECPFTVTIPREMRKFYSANPSEIIQREMVNSFFGGGPFGKRQGYMPDEYEKDNPVEVFNKARPEMERMFNDMEDDLMRLA